MALLKALKVQDIHKPETISINETLAPQNITSFLKSNNNKGNIYNPPSGKHSIFPQCPNVPLIFPVQANAICTKLYDLSFCCLL